MDDLHGATAMTWEELEECGELDRRLQHIVQPSSQYQSQSYGSLSVMSRPRDTSQLTSTPPVRILKRQPNSDPCLVSTDSRDARNRPVKTLQEREAAYAEARLRILGSASAAAVTDTALVNSNAAHRKATKNSLKAANGQSVINGSCSRR